MTSEEKAVLIVVKNRESTLVINGKVVALCQHLAQCDSARVFTLSDKPLLCHGYGLIRGIDCEKEILYINTPMSDALREVNTLLYTDWVPDLGAFESNFKKGTVIPYSTVSQDQHKDLMISPRRRFNPLQLIRMTRKS